MRYLIHSADGTYDAATGITTHTIDQRWSNPTLMVVRRVIYVGQESPPPVHVYCRSSALSALAQYKHTVELTTGPESPSNVIAVLPESYAAGRYETKSETVYPVLGHVHLRSIDIYFTEGSRLLTPAAIGGGSSVLTPGEVAVLSNLFLYLDYSDSAKVTTTTGGGGADYLTQVEAVNTSTFQFVPSSGSGILYEDFGTNGAKCANFDTVDWVRLNDNSTAEEPETGTLCLLFQSQGEQSDISVLTDWYRWRIYVNTTGKLAYYDGSVNDTTIDVALSTEYLITIRRDNAAQTFTWRLEKLSDNTVQTDSTANGNNSGGTGLFDIGGSSSYSAAGHKTSNLILIESIADADVEAIELHLRNAHTAQAAPSGTTTSGEYLVELEIDSR